MRKEQQDMELPLLSPYSETKKDISPHTKNRPRSYFMNYLDSSSPSNKYLQHYSLRDRLTFIDMMPYIKKINNSPSQFNFSDMPLLDKNFNAEAKMIEIDSQWLNELSTSSPSFAKAVYRAFRKDFYITVALLFVDSTTRICSALYMAKMINIINSTDGQEEVSEEELFSSAIILSLLVLISFMAKNWSYYFAYTRGAKARYAISGLIYKKLNSISLTSVNEVKIGKVINLIGNEMRDLESNALQFPVLIFSPYMICLGAFIMWQYFGVSCLIGLGCITIFFFGQIYVSNRTEVPKKENKQHTDNRVKVTNEIIECIRLIKMYAWEKPFKNIIEDLRRKEVNTFIKIAVIDGLGKNFSMLSVYASILVICVGYIQLGGVLSPEKVYGTMVVLMFLGNYVLLYAYFGKMALINLRLIFRRVQDILDIKDVLSLEEANADQKYSQGRRSFRNQPAITFENFTAYWSQNSKNPCLSNINLSIQPGTLTTIIGKIGSGKTSLLLSLLREIPITKGVLECKGKIAYVEQEPIIFSGTLRENILFGKKFNEDFYRHVIQACSLNKDLETFSHGDLTLIGERGVNLSGGQKARISLARAIYSESDIYLLDDPFSAVDSKVARDIFNQVLKGDLLKDKTTILVTHHLHFARESDYVVLMDEGRVQKKGAFSEVEGSSTELLNVFKVESRKASVDSQVSDVEEEKLTKNKKEVVAKVAESKKEEKTATVSSNTYKTYFTIIGKYKDLFIFIGLLVSFEAISIYYTRFIGYWALQHKIYHDEPLENDFNNSGYILQSCLMLLLMPILNYVKLVRMSRFLLSTNTELHKKMINALIRAKTLFFDINPVGSILNRFSNDLGTMDKANVANILDLINGLTETTSLVLTVCVINPTVFIPAVLVGFSLHKITSFFKKALIVTKKLELNSKSPILSTLPSTLHGLIIIRVYNQGGRYVREFMELLYSNSRAFLFMAKTIRLLALLLDSAIHSLSVAGILAFAFAIVYYRFEPGLVGLSLLSLLRIGEKSNYVLRQILYVDVNMQSAQRMIEYTNLESEAEDHIPGNDKVVETQFLGKWPVRGDITFNEIYLRYREGLNFALNGLSFKVQGGTKVACVGRTGAGKSSIIQALFRMVESEDEANSYIKIDGVDIKTIGLHLLRSRLSIIPQTPVVFTGTIRRNLDPFGKLSDSEIWNALEEVSLKQYVEGLGNKLDTDMTLSASVFSAGQKQLICLARAILMNNKIIVLDEATANVDIKTDHFIQQKIKEKFSDCTVLTIAHRLITIADYDKVIVMDNGKLVEHDSPYVLLVEKVGDLSITKIDGLFADMVRNTGKNMSKKIFEIAKNKFFENK